MVKNSYNATINDTDSSVYFMFTSNGEVFLDDVSVSPVTVLSGVVSTKLWNNDCFHKISMKLDGVYFSYKVFNVMGNEINFGLSDNSLKLEVSRESVFTFLYKG